MNLSVIKSGAKITEMYVKDHMPQILMTTGFISEGAAIVSSCYAMTKMEAILDNHKKKADELRLMSEEGSISKEDLKKEQTKLYFETGKETAKYWIVPVGCTTVSVLSFLGAYNKINKKYIGTAAALTALSDKFVSYRENVKEDVGEDRDKIYMNNGILRAKSLRLKNGNKKDGTQKKYTDDEINKACDPEEVYKNNEQVCITNYPYQFEWSRDTVHPDYFNEHSHLYNVQFIHNYMTSYWNNRLQSEGIVRLNDVLKKIGLFCMMSDEFDDIGWCKTQYDDRCDGFVDFGFDKNEVLTPERQMWLDPTPDIEQMFKKNPDSDRVMLVFNCCDIREAKKRIYGDYFGKDGKINFLKAYKNAGDFENLY